MPSEKVLYHNNRCSKSRAALQLLQTRGIDAEIVDYQKQPLDSVQLRQLYAKLGLDSVRGMMRTKDELYQNLQLADDKLTDDDLIDALAQHPALLERPIFVSGARAAIGRPLENIEALLD